MSATRAKVGYFGTGIVGAMNLRDFATRCMNVRGYRLVPADATAVKAW